MVINKIVNDVLENVWKYDIPIVDMLLTSPPYFDARDYGNKKLFQDVKVWEDWCSETIIYLSNFVKNDGVIWWNTGSGYKDFKKMTSIYRIILACEASGIFLIEDIPWLKKSSPPKNIKNRPYAAYEHNFIFSREPRNVIFYKDNVRRPYNPGTLKRLEYGVGKLSANQNGEYGDERKIVKANPLGASPPNYLILAQDYSKRPHPAPMSPELANWAIRAYTKEGDTVLDPMAGIGTTWVECKKLKRNFVGFEMYQEYIDIANLSIKRYEDGKDPYHGLIFEWRNLNENNKTDN